jgi:hypothetical protein
MPGEKGVFVDVPAQRAQCQNQARMVKSVKSSVSDGGSTQFKADGMLHFLGGQDVSAGAHIR